MPAYRPTADVSAPGWSSTAGTLAGAINEVEPDDASYVTSPVLEGDTVSSYVFEIGPLPVGAHLLNLRVRRVGDEGEIRLVLLDAAGDPAGVSDWHSPTDDWAAHTFSVEATAVSPRVRLEARGAADIEVSGALMVGAYPLMVGAFPLTFS